MKLFNKAFHILLLFFVLILAYFVLSWTIGILFKLLFWSALGGALYLFYRYWRRKSKH